MAVKSKNKSPFDPRRYPELLGITAEGSRDAKQSLADEVHDQILLKIIRGDLPGGTELKSTALAAQLGVSRTPVIRALAQLSADGIVSQALNRRAVVRSGAENWLVDLHHMRFLLEPEAARFAAGHIPGGILSDLELLERDAAPAGGQAWFPAARYLDRALHLSVAEFCGNLPMRETVRRFWRYKHLSYDAGDDTAGALREGHRQHAAILAQLSSGNGPGAACLMREHLEAAAARLEPGERIV